MRYRLVCWALVSLFTTSIAQAQSVDLPTVGAVASDPTAFYAHGAESEQS